MSVRAIDAVFTSSRAKGADRLVLLALADVASSTGEVSAYGRSYTVLAAKANVARSSVQLAVEALIELGELERIAPGDGRKSADYRIVLPGLEGTDGRYPGEARSVPRVPNVGTPSLRSSPSSSEPPTPAASGGAPDAPQQRKTKPRDAGTNPRALGTNPRGAPPPEPRPAPLRPVDTIDLGQPSDPDHARAQARRLREALRAGNPTEQETSNRDTRSGTD